MLPSGPMYTIIGVDGKEYGPVTAGQIQQWVAAGRADRGTRCKVAGSFEWKTIGDFPELAASAAPAGILPPLAAAAPAAAPATAAPAAPLDIVHCYERSWKLLKANFWPMVGVTLIVWIWTGSLFGAQRVFHSNGLGLLGLFLNPLLYGAVVTFFVRKAKGTGAPGMADFFGGFGAAYGRLLAIYIVMFVLIVLGLILLVLPGIYLAVSYQFAYLLAVDQGRDIWASVEGSRQLIRGNWWRMFGLVLLGIPFSLLGLACLGVGLLVTTPLVIGAIYYAYLDLSHQNPPEPPAGG